MARSSARAARNLIRAWITRSGAMALAPSRATTMPLIRSKRPRGCASTQARYSWRLIGRTGSWICWVLLMPPSSRTSARQRRRSASSSWPRRGVAGKLVDLDADLVNPGDQLIDLGVDLIDPGAGLINLAIQFPDLRPDRAL